MAYKPYERKAVAKMQLFCYNVFAGVRNDMSQLEKLKQRLLSKPKDFTIEELDKLLLGMGYVRLKQGKTTGSKIEYKDADTGISLVLHSPHPQKEIKVYAVQRIIKFLAETGRLTL